MKGLITVLAAAALTVPAVAQKQPQPKSKREAEAIQAIFAAQTPDARIAAAEALLQKFADTEFKAIALQLAAASAEEKNDFEKVVLYSERTIEADPKNYACMLMLARGYAARTREFDLDKEEKLGKADKYAKDALEVLKTVVKPRPDIDDMQWEAAKKDFNAQAYEAMGMAAVVRKKYEDAVTNFKLAIEGSATPDPATKVRMVQALNNLSKWDEALAVLEPMLADTNLNPTIRQFAAQEKVKAAMGKAKK
jgi:tetratricopeptide (TPR) repeat protein